MTRSSAFYAMIITFSLAVCVKANASEIDNSMLGKAEFREHKATYGVVYKLPTNVIEAISWTRSPLKVRLDELGMKAENRITNIPHLTVVHIHNADPATPQKMMRAMPELPPPIHLTFKNFYTTEAAKDAGFPWWFDFGVVKSGDGYEQMMVFNTRATAALTPLRDGPLPRCTGLVYQHMSDAAKTLVKTVGVSGVNVVEDGKEVRAYNPHTTLVYSMTPFSENIQKSMQELADEFNKQLPDGYDATFNDVSIVEIGFAGNVLREFYRFDLKTGDIIDVATGQKIN